MQDYNLLEREALLEQLKAHGEAAARSSGRLVFVGGEAGVGKSALVERFHKRHSGAAVILRGACDAMSAPTPLAPLIDFAPELGEGFVETMQAGEPRTLFPALLERFRASPRPQIVVIEDLQWADEATLDLLRFLGRRIGDLPVLLLCTFRDDETHGQHPLRRLLGDLAAAPSVYRLEVPTLSAAAVATLAGNGGVDPATLHEMTGGNAFFVTEVLAAGGPGVPAKVGDAVMARVSRLSPGAIQALEVASVAGQNTVADLLTVLVPAPTAIDECVAAGLLVGRHATLSFRHELARQAVLESIPETRRARTHGAILHELETRLGIVSAHGGASELPAPPDSALAVLAHHAFMAGDSSAILRYAPAAGRLAMRLNAYREARIQFSRALPYANRLGAHEHSELMDLHSIACNVTGYMEECVASRRAAADLLNDEEDAERKSHILCRLTWTLCTMLRDDEATTTFQEALALLRDREDSPARAFAYYFQAWKKYQHGDAGLRLARRAEELARAHDNGYMQVRASTVVSMALAANARVVAAEKELSRAVETATDMGQHDLTLLGIHQVTSGLLETFRGARVDRLLRRGLDLSREMDFDWALAFLLSNQALSYLFQGRWREAEEAAQLVLQRDNVSPTVRIWVTLVRATVLLRTSEEGPGEVLRELEECAKTSPRLSVIVAMRAVLAEAALVRGDPDAARAELEGVYARALTEGSHWHVGRLAYWVWRAGGDPSLPDEVRGPFALQARGQPRRAARHWARLGCPYERATALSESNDVADLREALRSFEDLGARPAATSLAQRLKHLGVRGIPRGPQAMTRQHPAGLTPREQQVLELMVVGLRNAEIARRNRVSSRTVDHQVSAVLGKLGVRSRAEAVAEAYRLGLVERVTA